MRREDNGKREENLSKTPALCISTCTTTLGLLHWDTALISHSPVRQVQIREPITIPVHSVIILVLVQFEETVVDHKIIHLPDLLNQAVVLLQERQQLLRWTIDGQLIRLVVLSDQHVLEQLLAQAKPLPALVHVKVQDAGRIYRVRVTLLVEHVQELLSHLQQPGHQSTVRTGHGE